MPREARAPDETGEARGPHAPVADAADAGNAADPAKASEADWAAGRYLRLMGIGAGAAFLLLWAWVAAVPLAFLDPEYPYWRAKQAMLHDCDLGEVLILGDSRAAAGVLAAALPMRAANLAVGGGKPVEAYAALTRALACPVAPRRVVLSMDAAHFVQADLFWERAVRFGFVGSADLARLRATADASGDRSLFAQQRFAGLPGALRDWLYVARFPSLYFASLVQGGGVLRWPENERALAAGRAARGQYYFGTEPGSDAIAIDGHMASFIPAPVLDRYFDRILAVLAARGIPADFVSLPMNRATEQAVQPAVRAAFAAYLARYEARYPGFHVLGPVMRAWPDRLFGDGFAHLNPAGAALFTAAFGRCL
ncbi:MAG: hypothetical protein P4L71_03115, partial [Acetobacteraceae bacterium]|nr:hypothetical protein [Acetobacteraceae bacterium]